eukprot:scaffold75401_cov33-Tisochrysis_lutea.AAC.6
MPRRYEGANSASRAPTSDINPGGYTTVSRKLHGKQSYWTRVWKSVLTTLVTQPAWEWRAGAVS